MGVFTTTDAGKLYDTIMSKIQEDIGETLYPGDERRIFAEAIIAWTVVIYNTIDDTAKQGMLKWARNEILDAIGEGNACTRNEAIPAVTTVKFSMSTSAPTDVTIPSGSRVGTEDGKIFFTDEEIIIASGDLSGTVTATAVEGGSEYNGYLPGSVNQMVDLIAYIETVSNTTETDGGSDRETDDAYRERIRLALSSFSTAGPKDAYKYFAMSADNRISDTSVTSPSANNISISFVMSDGSIPDDEAIERVQAAVTADDVKPLGDQVTVSAPTTSSYNISVKYYVTSDKEAEAVQAIESETYTKDGQEKTGAIELYRLWQDTKIGRDINPDKLKALIMNPAGDGSVSGADRVEITYPVFTEIADGTVAHFSGNLTISHETIEDA